MSTVEKHSFALDSHDDLIKILPELKLDSGRPVSKIYDGYNEDGTIKLRDAKVGYVIHTLSEKIDLQLISRRQDYASTFTHSHLWTALRMVYRQLCSLGTFFILSRAN